MSTPVTFTLNGQTINAKTVDPHTTLLSWLRSSGFTGSKEGCAEGECGACAVMLLRPDVQGSRYESVNGCLLLLASLAGQEVWTVEGLAQQQKLHPTQEAMLQGGSQCGYCTPGFIVSMAAEYYRKDREDFDLEALSGNLCRCTGYRPIKDAADALGKPERNDPLARRLEQPAPAPQSFNYTTNTNAFYRPTSLGEFFEILKEQPEAKLVAGGTDWVVEINQRFSKAKTQIALDQLPELKTFVWQADYVEIGAGLTLSELEHLLKNRIPILSEWFPRFASKLIRNRATLGGNIGTASPIGDSPPVLLVLDASLVLVSATGERVVKLDGFFTGYRKTVLEKGEIIKALRIPLPIATVSRFYKVCKRPMDDISTVAMGVTLELTADTVKRIRIGLGGVAVTPVRAYQTEAAMVDKPWALRNVQAASEIIKREFKPIDDHRGSATYRVAMLGNLLEKFFHDSRLKIQD
ncbi:MAG: xanthine dehydrogenase small subunit [Trueperaceae bacterium]